MAARPPTVRLLDTVVVAAVYPQPVPGVRASLCIHGRLPVAESSRPIGIPPGRVPVLLFVSVEDARRLGAFDLDAAPSDQG